MVIFLDDYVESDYENLNCNQRLDKAKTMRNLIV